MYQIVPKNNTEIERRLGQRPSIVIDVLHHSTEHALHYRLYIKSIERIVLLVTTGEALM